MNLVRIAMKVPQTVLEVLQLIRLLNVSGQVVIRQAVVRKVVLR